MFNINFTHSSKSSSNQKTFVFTGVDGMTIEQKIPPQCQHIIQLAYALSLEQPTFTLGDLIHYIDGICALTNTTFTNSKGGTERIVRYYSKLLQDCGIITNFDDVEPVIDAEE